MGDVSRFRWEDMRTRKGHTDGITILRSANRRGHETTQIQSFWNSPALAVDQILGKHNFPCSRKIQARRITQASKHAGNRDRIHKGSRMRDNTAVHGCSDCEESRRWFRNYNLPKRGNNWPYIALQHETPKCYLKSSVHTVFHQANKHCSITELWETGRHKLLNLFITNEYPNSFINSCPRSNKKVKHKDFITLPSSDFLISWFTG